jgi:hypothetical protein
MTIVSPNRQKTGGVNDAFVAISIGSKPFAESVVGLAETMDIFAGFEEWEDVVFEERVMWATAFLSWRG